MDTVLDATLPRFYSDRMRQYAIGLSFVAMAGCSFVFVSGPPANHREVPSFECSSSRVVPILDTVWTALMTLNLIGSASQSDAEWDKNFEPNDPPFSRKAGMVTYAVAAAAGAAGMVYGYTKTGACRSAKEEWTVRMQQGQGMQPGGPAQPGTWPPPGPGSWPPPQNGTAPTPGTWPPPPPASPPAAPPAPAPAEPPPPTS